MTDDNRGYTSMGADELCGHCAKPAKAQIAIALCSLAVMALLFATACSKPLTSVGGFSVEGTSAYEVRESNPMGTVVVDDGRELQKCDATVVAKGHEEERAVGATWYGGVAFDEAKTYLSELCLSGSQEVSGHEDASGRPDLSSQWATAEKKVVDKRDIMLEGGTPAFLYVWETTAELGQPYASVMTQVVFPTGEDSIGWVGYTAFSEEQRQANQTLLDEVLKHIVID